MHAPVSPRSQSNSLTQSFLPSVFRASCKALSILAPDFAGRFLPGVFNEPIPIRPHSFLFREMGVLLLSLVFSGLALSCTTSKICVLTYRLCQPGKTTHGPDIFLSLVLWFLNIALLVVSIIPRENVLDILLSLANGALIFYQYMWAGQFTTIPSNAWVHSLVAGTLVLLTITNCVLSSVLPIALKKGHKGSHVAGLLFFLAQYALLELFYWHIFLGYREKEKQAHGRQKNQQAHGRQKNGAWRIHDILLWNLWLGLFAITASIAALIAYALSWVNFELSLWIKYTAAGVWFSRWLVLQVMGSFTSRSKASSPIPSFETNPSASKEALHLRLPSPVHPHTPRRQSSESNLDKIQWNSDQGSMSASLSSPRAH